jgi:hypothetical protein
MVYSERKNDASNHPLRMPLCVQSQEIFYGF